MRRHKERRRECAENERNRDVNPTHESESVNVVFFGCDGVGIGRSLFCHIVDCVFFTLAAAIAFAESRRYVRDKVKHIVSALSFVLFELVKFHKIPLCALLAWFII